MFATVIAARLLAVLFTFCGVVQLCAQLSGPRPESAGAFAEALLNSCWPLAVAGAIELLVQIACMLEKMLLQRAEAAEKATAERKGPLKPVVKKSAEPPASASGQFFRSNPMPEPPVAPTPKPEPRTEAPAAAAEKPKTEQKEEPKPEKKDSGLSFFRVD